jgi:DNA polymerase III subunit beta
MTTATASRKRTRLGGMTVSAATLSAALRSVSAAVPTRSPKPVLQNVLIRDGVITATDLELRITAPLDGSRGHTLLLPFARLSAIIGSLVGTDEVTLAVDGTVCTVTGGSGEWKIPVEDAAEFPAGDYKAATPIARLPSDQFVALVNAVRFATDNESSRFALGAVLVEFKAGTLTFVGTDGRRLCAASADIDQDTDDCEILAPRRVVDVLVRLCKGAQAIQLERTGSDVVATIDGVVVQAKLVEGRFPKWRDVEPQTEATPSLVVAGALLHAFRQAAICTSEESKGVTLAITDEGLWLHGQSSAYGESSATCGLVEAGQACTVKLDPRFVREWLECGSIDPAETVCLTATDGDSAVVLSASETIRTVIMPLARDA